MKVIAILTIDGVRETKLEGNTDIFDREIWVVPDKGLAPIGFWLSDWRYCQTDARPHKSRVFVPWTSALYVEELVP